MTIPVKHIYPRTGDRETIYLKHVITNPNITVGDFTIYNDFSDDPISFEKNNVLYHYPINNDKLQIGKFCSIACGAKFIFNSANHTLSSLSTYPFPLFFEEWGSDKKDVTNASDNRSPFSCYKRCSFVHHSRWCSGKNNKEAVCRRNHFCIIEN